MVRGAFAERHLFSEFRRARCRLDRQLRGRLRLNEGLEHLQEEVIGVGEGCHPRFGTRLRSSLVHELPVAVGEGWLR
jgi:hypothetical protein